MIEKIINGITYKLPTSQSDFQERMYVHLINWKWKNISKESGIYNYKGKELKYDAILPVNEPQNDKLIYNTVFSEINEHRKKYRFKYHIHFKHMASSQAANINLFLPILLHSKADEILRDIDQKLNLNLDFNRVAKDKLYKGFRIEFWDGNSNEKGLLGDHNANSGTDSDIGIAYYNKKEELCLWLIEHKLTEKEFTVCGGARSDNNLCKSNCLKPAKDILNDNNLCYYSAFKGTNYWTLTKENTNTFANLNKQEACPFKGGMNQLWRN